MKAVAIDDRLQNLANSARTIAVLLVEAGSPLSPLMVAGVANIEHKLQRSKCFRGKSLDGTLEVASRRLDSACPLERVLHMFAERHAGHDK
jgi:hypothetical protein